MWKFLVALSILFDDIQAVCRNAVVSCSLNGANCQSDDCFEQGAVCNKHCICVYSHPWVAPDHSFLHCLCDAATNKCKDNGCAVSGGECVLRTAGAHKDECWCDPTPEPTPQPTPCPPPPDWRVCTKADNCDDCISCIQYAADGKTMAFCEKNPEDGECAWSGIGGGIDPTCIIKEKTEEPCDFKYKDDGVDRTWYEAKKYCEVQYGTELGTITTQQQLDCVLDLINDAGGTSPWTGLNALYPKIGLIDPFIYTYLDDAPCPIPYNGLYGQCVYSEWWLYRGKGGGRPRCPHNNENGSKCVRLLPDPIGLMDNDIKCDDGSKITAVLCNSQEEYK